MEAVIKTPRRVHVDKIIVDPQIQHIARPGGYDADAVERYRYVKDLSPIEVADNGNGTWTVLSGHHTLQSRPR